MILYMFVLTAVSALSELSVPNEASVVIVQSQAEVTSCPQEPTISEETPESSIFDIIRDYCQIETDDNNQKIAQDTIDTTQEIQETSTAQSQSITIKNSIDNSMLAYKHWTGTYSPENFSVSINGTELTQGSEYSLEPGTSIINVQYSYSFMKNMYTGTKTLSYKLNDNTTEATITFSWHSNPKVIIDNATVV